MGRSLLEQMCDVFEHERTIRWSNVSRCRNERISEEKIFVRNKVKDMSICRTIQDATLPSGYSEKINEWATRNADGSEDDYEIYRMLKCDEELKCSGVVLAYKYAIYMWNRHGRSYPEVFKWRKDGNTYYINRNMIFREDKSLMMSFDVKRMFVGVLSIDSKCVNGTDFMSKFLMNTFIPAYTKTMGTNVVIRDMSDETKRTSSYKWKYKNSDELNMLINNGLHKIAAISDIS